MAKFDLEDRFIEYTINTSTIIDKFDNSRLANHIGGQLVRSSSSPALNYGEAQGAESRKDFIHKMKIILKELKESRICLKIAKKKPLVKDISIIEPMLKETEELIAISFKSIETARYNLNKEQK